MKISHKLHIRRKGPGKLKIRHNPHSYMSDEGSGVTIEQLKGPNLKRDLHMFRVVKRWHNHNTTGGNFGINL